ncbi:tetratricopeptide repeat-containing hybrid sensor histidine kinase/response regulator [Flavobacterium aquicola]|uniref:histidine kinase n=1 Tax=Flavobacterium aquicola TaxID=1682742 RepID=A0A3E0EN29_9FLAO|nr:response regulator [Flavobacterium aquicola]REG99588.1 signal transduction histidine kinase [Flavobacterium aquicola]
MPRIRIVLLFALWLNVFGSTVIGQTQLSPKKEILKLNSSAVRHRESGDFEKSLLISRIALRKAIFLKDNILIAENYNNVAANFNALAQFDKAVFYYRKALSYADLTENDTIKQRINNNLGNMYCFEKRKFSTGIIYYKTAIEYGKKISDSTQLAFTNLNLTWALFDTGKFNEGEESLKLINSYYKNHKNGSLAVVLNMLNGMYYNFKNEDSTADFYFREAIWLGNDKQGKSDLSYSHLEYSKLLMKLKDYKNAYDHLEIYTRLNDELYAEEKLEKANIEGINFQLDEYKRTIDKIEYEKDLQFQSLKKSRIIVLLFIIAIFVLLLFLNSLIKNNKFRLKSNSDLLTANKELIIANKKAEESALLKTQFVSTISHELRTPLYGVVGIADLLLEEHKELSHSPHLNSLKFSARYLLSLVNDILQINKIEENKIVLDRLIFNLTDEFHMIKDSLSFIAKKNNNIINIHVDPLIPESLIGDKLRFAQILMNLVSNALKFTKDGKIDIIAKQIAVEGEMHSIEVKIKDNGIGIADVDQNKIFDKFVQVGRKELDYQGTGLGLSIVKRLLELFGSDITVESELGSGTVFAFCINFECNFMVTNEIINNIQVDVTSNEIFKVLVVEDNPINQLITKKTIEKNGYSCQVVDDGFKALEILAQEEFDIILMDINMPVINGFETSRRIRAEGIDTPIIALTAFDKNEITDEAIMAGMNDIIVKPFESIQLFKIMNSLILKSKSLV